MRIQVVLVALGVLAVVGGDAFAQNGLADLQSFAQPDTTATAPKVCCVEASDVPDDGGGAIHVTWELEGDDKDVRLFEVLRYAPGEEPSVVGGSLRSERAYTDTEAETGVPYQYVVRAVTSSGAVESTPSDVAIATAQWFSIGRIPTFIIALLFSIAVLWFVRSAKGGKDLFIRKIPGLDAVDDAVGRATEMGRPVLYVPGIETVSEVGTLAALTILGHVAKRVAEHGTPLDVPCADPIVMTTAQEIVRQSYTEVGRLDNYDPNRVAYLT